MKLFTCFDSNNSDLSTFIFDYGNRIGLLVAECSDVFYRLFLFILAKKPPIAPPTAPFTALTFACA